ncbi:DNA primase family protein [Pseudoalteromonas luteoviolacea]|uniref:DNA primase family protein n=1 Tax=Pseudoalteromonas luteoviolacea TaxID=43657 RepID=UPI001B378418|nr:DUF5906 domain-containing protein [Pseudoalteromonas luteoviolacea]MBQ4840118.1 hypothetical protein [Pseudoalteromonas luteoviolacea]
MTDLTNTQNQHDNNNADRAGLITPPDTAGPLNQPSAIPDSTEPLNKVNNMDNNNNGTDTPVISLESVRPQADQKTNDTESSHTPFNDEQKRAWVDLFSEAEPIPESLESLTKADRRRLLNKVMKNREQAEKESRHKSGFFTSECKDSDIRDHIFSNGMLNSVASLDYGRALFQYSQAGYWQEVPEEAFSPRISYILDGLISDGYNGGKLRNIVNMTKERLQAIPAKQAGLIGFSNCVLEVGTGRTLQHSPEYGLTSVADYNYDKNKTECPNFDAWLSHSSAMYSKTETVSAEVNGQVKRVPKPDVQATIDKQQLIMAALYMIATNRFDWQMFIEVVGEGGTGKSVFLSLAQMLVGEDNSCSLDMGELECTTTNFGLEPIVGKNLITIPDAKKMAGDFNNAKKITGGDPIPIQRKGTKNITLPFAPAVLLITANQPLAVTDQSTGIWRRRVIIVFNNIVKEEDKDPRLKEKFKDEIAAIFNKVLSAFETEKQAEKVLREAVKSEEKYEITSQTDPLLRWLEESIDIDQDAKEKIGGYHQIIKSSNTNNDSMRERLAVAQKLYPNYSLYCEFIGVKKPLALNNFINSLMSLANKMDKFKGITKEKDRTNVSWVVGLKINSEAPHLKSYNEQIELNKYRVESQQSL